jgi:hypothetical protein
MDGPDGVGVEALADRHVTDALLPDRFSSEPVTVLERFGVGWADLRALAALVEVRSRGHLPADRRACQALVFLALASARE